MDQFFVVLFAYTSVYNKYLPSASALCLFDGCYATIFLNWFFFCFLFFFVITIYNNCNNVLLQKKQIVLVFYDNSSFFCRKVHGSGNDFCLLLFLFHFLSNKIWSFFSTWFTFKFQSLIAFWAFFRVFFFCATDEIQLNNLLVALSLSNIDDLVSKQVNGFFFFVFPSNVLVYYII